MKYNWQQEGWPEFTWDISGLEGDLLALAEMTGRVDGMLAGLPPGLQMDALVGMLVEEAVRTSAIEGEILGRPDVYSSVRRCLGLEQSHGLPENPQAKGISEATVDARNTFSQPLTQQKLFFWHRLLFQSGSASRKIAIGKWRSHPEPMQIISGVAGKQKAHFEAPPSATVPQHMRRYIAWFNQSAPAKRDAIIIPVVRAAIAHLYFESIHPFEDGNGRIGRMIAEKAMAQGLGRPVLLSLSRVIESNRREYYAALEHAQRVLCATEFIRYFLGVALRAQQDALADVEFILHKVRFMDRFKNSLNDRQRKVILRMFAEGPKGFAGGMSAKKYMALTRVSKATATRDLTELLACGALRQIASGRTTRYELVLQAAGN